MQVAPRTRKNTRKSKVWSWLKIGTAVAVLLGIGVRMSADYKPAKPALTAARALGKTGSGRLR